MTNGELIQIAFETTLERQDGLFYLRQSRAGAGRHTVILTEGELAELIHIGHQLVLETEGQDGD